MEKNSSSPKPRLLFITQKIHERDDDLAFVILWIKEFMRQGVDVEVICLEKREFGGGFPVHSLGKEKGWGTARRLLEFFRLIITLKYDRVFVHMNPEYVTLGGWYWWLRGVPMYLWYTHYTMHIHMWISGHLCKRLFAATPQSLPQYEGSPKKIITGHGIDIDFWLRNEPPRDNKNDPHALLTVHRICRSKRLERSVRAIHYLPKEYKLTVYGRDVERDYHQEILKIINSEQLGERVDLAGPLPMDELRSVYPRYRIMVNMASETIDKTMLEGMLFGVYPVTTPANSRAIGLPVFPENETPEAISDFIKSDVWHDYNSEFLSTIVRERHSLSALVQKISSYIREGK